MTEIKKEFLSLIESLANQNPKAQPSRPPEINAECDLIKNKLHGETLEKVLNNIYTRHEEYFKEKWNTELYNRDTFLWLWDVYQSETDLQKRHALEMKLEQFKAAIEKQKIPYPSLRITFRKYPYKNPRAQQIDIREW